MKRLYTLYVRDILDAMNAIESFTADLDFVAFQNDEKTRSAVIWKIAVIRYKDVPWKDMAGMRDKISHSYFGIQEEIVWKVVKDRLPQLKATLEKILQDTPDKLLFE